MKITILGNEQRIKLLKQRALELPVKVWTRKGKFFFYYWNSSCCANSLEEVIQTLEGLIKRRFTIDR